MGFWRGNSFLAGLLNCSQSGVVRVELLCSNMAKFSCNWYNLVSKILLVAGLDWSKLYEQSVTELLLGLEGTKSVFLVTVSKTLSILGSFSDDSILGWKLA